jgi:hypothetical protein
MDEELRRCQSSGARKTDNQGSSGVTEERATPIQPATRTAETEPGPKPRSRDAQSRVDRTPDGLPPLIVGVGRGSVLLKRHNDLVEAVRITPEEIQTAIEHIRAPE